MARTLPLILCLIAATGCSTAKIRVMPGERGINRVVVRDIERDDAEEEALDAANEYCEDRERRAVFLEEKKVKYTGSMNENTRKTVRNASKAGQVVGGIASIGSSSPVGDLLFGAGTAGQIMTSDRDYTSELRFKCI